MKKIAKKRGLSSNEAIRLAFVALVNGHKYSEVCKTYGIRKSSLRDHYVRVRKSRKIRPKAVLTMEEEDMHIQYLEEMVKISCPLNIAQLKLKVAEITQTRKTPFTNGMLGKSWIKWFREKHPFLVLRSPEALDMNRAKALCPQHVTFFYKNLEDLYSQHQYESSQVWNCDENGAEANKNGERMVLAGRGIRSVDTIVPNEREWISILVAINAVGDTMPCYYIFKGKRPK